MTLGNLLERRLECKVRNFYCVEGYRCRRLWMCMRGGLLCGFDLSIQNLISFLGPVDFEGLRYITNPLQTLIYNLPPPPHQSIHHLLKVIHERFVYTHPAWPPSKSHNPQTIQVPNLFIFISQSRPICIIYSAQNPYLRPSASEPQPSRSFPSAPITKLLE